MEDKQPIIIRKKKIQAHTAHHGGAWKVAYADFVTAMMAFFMVMWLMGSDLETAKAIESYFKSQPIPTNGVSRSNPGAEGRFEENLLDQPHFASNVHIEEYSILKDLSDYYEGSAFTAINDGDYVKYILTPRIYFEKSSAVIPFNIETRQLFQRLTEIFRQHDGTILVEGFADNEQDWILSYGRALNVIKVLEGNGVPKNRLIPIAGSQERSDGDGLEMVNIENSRSVKFTLKRKR